MPHSHVGPQLYSLIYLFFLVKSDTLQPAHTGVIPGFGFILQALLTFIATVISF